MKLALCIGTLTAALGFGTAQAAAHPPHHHGLCVVPWGTKPIPPGCVWGPNLPPRH